mmetsp:Transcript_50244/g.129336  ORF Transcript_50244/g.129336 Transcript_50244/m.129336 type:complete len:552 (-) Transcript_50244:912-2567(-)
MQLYYERIEEERAARVKELKKKMALEKDKKKRVDEKLEKRKSKSMKGAATAIARMVSTHKNVKGRGKPPLSRGSSSASRVRGSDDEEELDGLRRGRRHEDYNEEEEEPKEREGRRRLGDEEEDGENYVGSDSDEEARGLRERKAGRSLHVDTGSGFPSPPTSGDSKTASSARKVHFSRGSTNDLNKSGRRGSSRFDVDEEEEEDEWEGETPRKNMGGGRRGDPRMSDEEDEEGMEEGRSTAIRRRPASAQVSGRAAVRREENEEDFTDEEEVESLPKGRFSHSPSERKLTRTSSSNGRSGEVKKEEEEEDLEYGSEGDNWSDASASGAVEALDSRRPPVRTGSKVGRVDEVKELTGESDEEEGVVAFTSEEKHESDEVEAFEPEHEESAADVVAFDPSSAESTPAKPHPRPVRMSSSTRTGWSSEPARESMASNPVTDDSELFESVERELGGTATDSTFSRSGPLSTSNTLNYSTSVDLSKDRLNRSRRAFTTSDEDPFNATAKTDATLDEREVESFINSGELDDPKRSLSASRKLDVIEEDVSDIQEISL